MSSKPDTNQADRADPAVVAEAMAGPDVMRPIEEPAVTQVAPSAGMTAGLVRRPVCVVRLGRGRLGGSTVMDLLIQRARFQGRRVKPLDGDLRSRTLASLYPAQAPDGSPIPDGASMPASEEVSDYKAWMNREFEMMVRECVSRVIDLGGGERVMQEFVRSFPLARYCDSYGVDLLPVFMLGPDVEDLNGAWLTTGSDGRQAGKAVHRNSREAAGDKRQEHNSNRQGCILEAVHQPFG